MFDDIPRRPLHAKEDVLGDRLTDIADLDDQDRASLLNVIDAVITKTRLRAITSSDS